MTSRIQGLLFSGVMVAVLLSAGSLSLISDSGHAIATSGTSCFCKREIYIETIDDKSGHRLISLQTYLVYDTISTRVSVILELRPIHTLKSN